MELCCSILKNFKNPKVILKAAGTNDTSHHTRTLFLS